MKKIPLTKGKFAIVDDEDFPYISRFKWTLGVANHAVRCMKLGRDGQVHMEYFIVSKPHGRSRYIFKNGNPLDCRKENILIMNFADATTFFKKTQKKTTSKYKGVCWDKREEKWCAYLTQRQNGKRVKVLYEFFDNEDDAARARNKKAKEVFGEFAYQNKIV